MSHDDIGPRPRALRGRWALRGLAALSVMLAFVALVSATRWAENRQRLLEVLEAAGVSAAHPHVARNISRETTPHQARILAARALVYHVLSLHSRDSSAAQLEAADAQLPKAAELARAALEEQPNSWQAAMILGMATYLERALARDRRLYTEARAWEAPLEKAVRDAAGYPEPRRLLATAYVESWHGLSPAKRGVAKGLLAQVFEDDLRAFEALAPAWLGLQLGPEETFSVVPDLPEVWKIMKDTYSRAESWQLYLEAHGRYLDSLEATLEAQVAEAEERLRLGDFFRGRSKLLEVIVKAPPSGRFAPIVRRALEAYPPGLHGLAATDLLSSWLQWALELDRIGVRPLSPVAVARLLDAIGEPDPPMAAAAALLAEDFYQADRFAKLARQMTLSSWSPYLQARAAASLEQGKAAEAHNYLSLVSKNTRDEIPFALLSHRIARAQGDVVEIAISEKRIEAAKRRQWTAFDWRTRHGRPMLEFLPEAPASGLLIEIASAYERGSVIEIRLDGTALARQVVRPGEMLRLETPLSAEAHQLAIQVISRTEVIPGRVRLIDGT